MKILFCRIILLIGICSVSNHSYAQRQGNIWYFGFNAGIDFNSGSAVPIFDGKISTDEGCATICDEEGQLLFYTDGITVWDRQHQIMPNGQGLEGDPSSTQSGVIVPHPGDPDLYYIFTVDNNVGSGGLKYTLVDLSLHGGLGDIVTSEKNIELLSPSTEKVTAVQHQNRTDIWVMAHAWNSDEFFVYKVGVNGLNAIPDIQSIGLVHTGGIFHTHGYLKASPDGSKVAVAMGDRRVCQLFDFDNTTGKLSNPLTIDPQQYVYGVEFSPDNSKLYLSFRYHPNIFQYDLNAGSAEDILNSQFSIPSDFTIGALQLARDGKIYATKYHAFLGVINNPDALGAEVEYLEEGVDLEPGYASLGLPTFVQSFFRRSSFTYIGSCLGDSTFFKLDDPEQVLSVTWNFGDPLSGIRNTSTEFNPLHIYKTPGIFKVIAEVVLKDGNSRTFTEEVIITNGFPDIDLGSDTIICPGAVLELDVTQEGAFTYTWQNNPTLNSPIFLVDSAGTYIVEVRNDCGVVWDTIQVSYIDEGPDLPRPRLLCLDETVSLDATLPYEGLTYQWNTGSTEPILEVNSSGVYEVTISLPSGCSIIKSTQFDYIDSLRIRQTNDSLGVVICRGEDVLLNIEPDLTPYLENQDIEFSWKDGSDSVTTTVSYLDTTLEVQTELFWVVISTSECAGFAQGKITFIPTDPPESDLPDSLEVCFGDTLAIDASTEDGLAYEWSRFLGNNANPLFLSNDPVLRTPDEGIYTVRIEGPACAKYDTVTVYYEYEPQVFLEDKVLCPDSEVTLRAFYQNISPAPPSYLWDDGSRAETRQVDSPGIYYVSISNSCGTITDTAEVILNTTPAPLVNLGKDTILCVGELLVLDATNVGGDYNYIWQDGSRQATYTVENPGTYQVKVFSACDETSDEIQVTYVSPPMAKFNPQTYLCSEEAITLNAANPNATYLWKDETGNEISSDSSIIISQPGTYTVSVTNQCATVDFSTQVLKLEDALDLGEDIYVCDQDTVIIGKELIDASYIWQDDSRQAQLKVTETGSYWVKATVNGCVATDTIQVIFLSDLEVDLGERRSICDGQAVVFDVYTPQGNYQWFDGTGALISTDSVLVVNEPGMYKVEIDNGCKKVEDQVEVVNSNLQVDLGADRFLCEGESFNLDARFADANTIYLWNNGSTQSRINVDTSGIYWVEVQLNDCIIRDSVEITFLEGPAVNIGPDTLLCPQSIYVLDATSTNSTYVWQDGSSNATFTVTEPGTYSVTVDNGCGQSTQEVVINYLNTPQVNFGEDRILCPNETLILDATNLNATYQWQDGSTAPTFLVSQAGTYSVLVRANGCTIQDEIVIDYKLPLSPLDLGEDRVLCPQETYLLDATSADEDANYLWQDGSSNATFTVREPGTYWVAIDNGCEIQRDSIFIDYYEYPQVDLGQNQLLCPNEIIVLDATNPNASYVWQDGSTSPNFTVNQGGLYWVEVRTDNGCVLRDSIQIIYKTNLRLELGDNQTLCGGENLVLNAANPFSTYLWQDGSQASTFTVTKSGTYSVVVTNGCDTLSDEVSIDFTPLPEVNFGNDTLLCFSEQIRLEASNENVTYLWQDGSRESSYLVNSEGTYWVEVTRDNCMVREEIFIGFQECVDDVEIPNTITPNGDGVNDVFMIDKLDLSNWILTIYNRNGSQVYQSDNYRNDWNGGNNPPAVYFYIFKQKQGGQSFRGWINVIK